MNYVIITPAKNESRYIEQTIKSILSQYLLPQEWVIVDDGSTDNTSDIVKKYSNEYSWVKLVKMNTSNEERLGGEKVVRAFNYGKKNLTSKDYQLITKLDADLILPPTYFQRMAEEFTKDVKLGLCGGYCVNIIDGKKIVEKSDNYHVRGAFKTYNRTCFEEIGGFMEIWNWDGIDEMMAMYKGWNCKTVDIEVIHNRPTSSAYDWKKQSFRSGIDSYQAGNNFILLILRATAKIKNKPYVLHGVIYIFGYLYSLFTRKEKYVNKEVARYINRFHINRILNKIIL